MAVGTFFTAADYGAVEYKEYIADKFNQSSFADSLTDFVKTNNWNMLIPEGFDAKQVFLGQARTFKPTRPDTFQDAAIDIMLGLYGFICVCIVAALVATLHACSRGADNVFTRNLFTILNIPVIIDALKIHSI